MARAEIKLNAREHRLRNLLLDVAEFINTSCSVRHAVTLRWAGGWVRDKLLSIESHDIDVAINNMTGVAFAQHMCTYCNTAAATEKHDLGKSEIGNLHNVARNPLKSKHLETAMVRMLGMDLDFVNLRKETYSADSRNPEIEFGTAEEDARRRDATINALFYNLHTDQVEDFTGGMQDLYDKTIRTPMEPLQTFTDDPLRVLRLVRFASRLSFNIAPMTRRHMDDPAVLFNLKVKISRERVGIELEKMLKGANPCRALELIDELGLYHAIFTNPSQGTTPQPDIAKWYVSYRCLSDILANITPQSICSALIRTDEERYIAWNLAALSPWMLTNEPSKKSDSSNVPPTVAQVAREGFKAPNKLSDVLGASYKHMKDIVRFKEGVADQESFAMQRDALGMSIRQWDSQGGSWRLQILNAILVESMAVAESRDADGSSEHARLLAQWQAFLDHITAMDLWNAPGLKRLLDGRQLSAALGCKPGKWTGKALDVCTAWQLRHATETDPTGAIDEVKRRREELGVPIS